MSDLSDRDDHLYRPSSFSHFHHHHHHHHHHHGAQGDSDDGGGDTSSDDDIHFVKGGGGGGSGSGSGSGRNRKRGAGFGYTTFGDEDDDYEQDDVMEQGDATSSGGGSRDEAIYGVFATSSGDADDDSGETGHYRGGKRRRRRPGGGGSGSGKANAAVSFVKSSTTEAGTDDKPQDTANTAKKEEEEDEETRRAREEEGRRKKEMEEANAKFHALLEKGRANSKRRKTTTSSSSARTAAKDSTAGIAPGRGPGFKSGEGGGGLGFQSGGNEGSEQNGAAVGEQQQSGLGSGGLGLGLLVGLGARPAQQGGGLGLGSHGGDDDRPSSSPSAMPPLSSFVSSSSATGLGLGLGAAGSESKKPAMKRDPNLGTWEKHTKGIGMKLLSKMGYSGSGGLGAKRVRKKVIKPPSGESGGSDSFQGAATKGGVGLGAAAAAATEGSAAPTTTATTNREETEIVHRKGISRAIEVVVRPANLGLGFGNFVEQSQLKVNRQIEAEVRGIDINKQEEEERKRKLEKEGRGGDDLAAMMGIPRSLLPSTHALVSEGGWRKGAASGAARKKRKERKFVSYEDIVKGEEDRGKEKIIDMRGPSAATAAATAAASTLEGGKVPLGAELLHNVTLLLNTYEDKVRSASHYVKSNQRKVESLKSEMKETDLRLDNVRTRITKLERVLHIFDRMERLHEKVEDVASGVDGDEDDIRQASSLIAELGENFTKEEKSSLRFYSDVVPSLLGPIAERRLKDWKPLVKDGADRSEFIMSSVVGLCSVASSDKDDSNDIWATKRALFVAHILPRIKRALQSSRWDPICDVEAGLALYEAVLRVAKDASPPDQVQASSENDEDVLLERPYGSLSMDGTKHLVTVVRDTVMYDVIFPKLSRCLAQFKPSSSLVDAATGKLQAIAPHSWILPWLPYLDYKTMLPNLLPDVKRKLRSILAYLSRTFSVGQDFVFFNASVKALGPWWGILEGRSLQSLASDVVTPRLGRYLSRIPIVKSTTEQDWKGIGVLYRVHGSGLLSNRDFLSLLEGEVLSSWAELLHTWLSTNDRDLVSIAKFYAAWKCKLFIPPADFQTTSTELKVVSWFIARKDGMICRHFYAGLRMIDAVVKSDTDALEDLLPPAMEESNYHSALARRTKEDRLREEAEMRAKVAAEQSTIGDHTGGVSSNRGGGTATFRDVVEDFARQNDVAFAPRMGANATKDGKQIFLFGNVPVYLDANVVFALRGSAWQPTSLEDLVLAAT